MAGTGAKERLLIGRTVAEHTAPDNAAPSADAQAALIKFLRNPATVDVTYNLLLDRVIERPAEAAVLRAVKLLKTHLAKHTPGEATLRRIDAWCQGLSAGGEAALKSAQYVRALVAKLVGGDALRRSGELLTPRSQAARHAEREPERRLPPALHGVTNALAVRAPLSPRRGAPTLQSSVLFGGQFKVNGEGGVAGEVLALDDVAQVRERVRTVAVEKKREESRQSRDGRDGRRRQRPLFQYRYYRQQTRLTLSAAESEAVVSAVKAPGAGDHEGHLIASKILVKLLIDALSADEQRGVQQASATLMELLALPSADAQLHALNVLFNLSVHAHLLDETALLAEPDLPPRPGSVDAVQAALFRLCLDMLRALLARAIEDERVWSAALNALLYFVTHNGRVVPRLLAQVDARLVPAFLRYLGPARDALQRKLVALLLAQLYPDGVLSSAAVKQAGGIDELAALYASTRSCSAADNLFLVLYDWALLQLPPAAAAEPAQAALLLRLLRRVEAPQFLRAAFRCVPERLVDALMRHVADPRLDKAFAAALLAQLEQLAQACTALSPEHAQRLAAMSAGGADLAAHVAALDQLLHSPVDSLRHSGELWLFGLMRLAADGRRPPPAAVLNAVETLQAKLLLSCEARVRRVYFSVTERQALHLRQKMQTAGDDYRLYALFKLLNDALSRLALPQFRERNEANLMHVVHTVLDLLLFRTEPLAADAPDADAPDANYDLFLRGRAAVSLALLNELNVSVLHALFVNLPAAPYAPVRTVLLLLVIERCRTSEALDAVGMAFFRGLLADRNPEIAYYASRFLLDELQAERPEQYTAMLNALLSKAQATNDEQLLANPYVQINEMIRGFASDDAAGRLSPAPLAPAAARRP